MPMMICAADRVIETTMGHVLSFTKNVPQNVPAKLVPFVMERGVFPAEGEQIAAAEATESVPTAKQLEPTDSDERQARIIAEIKKLHATSELIFTAGGKPSPAQLSKKLGFPIDAGERDTAWEACKAELTPS